MYVTVMALIGLELYPHEFHLRRVNVQIRSPRRAISLSLCFTKAFAAFFGWLLWACVRRAEKCGRMGLFVFRHLAWATIRFNIDQRGYSAPQSVYYFWRNYLAKSLKQKCPKTKTFIFCTACGQHLASAGSGVKRVGHENLLRLMFKLLDHFLLVFWFLVKKLLFSYFLLVPS